MSLLYILAALGLGSIFSDGFEGPPEPPAVECPMPDQGLDPKRAVILQVAQLGSIQTYEDLWGPWGAGSGTRHISMPGGLYASLPFTVPAEPADPFALIIWDQFFENPTQIRLSVSKCEFGAPTPEDAIEPTRCYRQRNGRSGAFNMNLTGASQNPRNCEVNPGETYFFKFEYAECNFPSCVWNASEN